MNLILRKTKHNIIITPCLFHQKPFSADTMFIFLTYGNSFGYKSSKFPYRYSLKRC